jgi:hypothetical protein
MDLKIGDAAPLADGYTFVERLFRSRDFRLALQNSLERRISMQLTGLGVPGPWQIVFQPYKFLSCQPFNPKPF